MIVKGYRGEMSVEKANELAARGIYVFNAMSVGSREHLEYAYRKAKEAMESGKNIARKMHIEIMLVLTGRRQINTALQLAGVEGANTLAAISEESFELELDRDDSVLKCSTEKLDYLGIEHRVHGKECEAFFENSAMLHLHR